MKSRKLRYLFIIGYLVFACMYFSVRAILDLCGMEYRSWVEVIAMIYIWLFPVIGAAYLFYDWRNARLERETAQTGRNSTGFRWGTGIVLAVYGIVMTLVSLFMSLLLLFMTPTERRLPNGILAVELGDAELAARRDYYYCEPVTIFARKRVEWDADMSVSYLNAVYDDTFTAAVCEDGTVKFASGRYPGVRAQVWDVGAISDNYEEEVNVWLLTQAMEEIAGSYPDAAWEIYPWVIYPAKNNGPENKYFMLDCGGEEQIEETAELAYELLVRVKDDGIYGDSEWRGLVSVFCFADTYPMDYYEDHHYSCSLRWEETTYESMGKEAVIAAFEEKLKEEYEWLDRQWEKEFRKYTEEEPEGVESADDGAQDSADGSTGGENENGTNFADGTAGEEQGTFAGSPDIDEMRQIFLDDYEEKKAVAKYQDIQGVDRELVDAVWLIYEKHYADNPNSTSGRPYCTYNAKGNFYAMVLEKEHSQLLLVYDGVSQNGKCHLFVAEEEHYDTYGQQMDNTSLKEFYAVNLEEGEVYEAHKTSWGGAEAEEYRKATRE